MVQGSNRIKPFEDLRWPICGLHLTVHGGSPTHTGWHIIKQLLYPHFKNQTLLSDTYIPEHPSSPMARWVEIFWIHFAHGGLLDHVVQWRRSAHQGVPAKNPVQDYKSQKSLFFRGGGGVVQLAVVYNWYFFFPS